jgi:3-phenylpropionate/trans-cinnamate dioxygenase ferredoxin reductase component
MSERLLIVGGGQAGAQAVQTLRQQGFAGAITLLGDEPYVPYQRPPLSKKYLAGELPRERLFLRPAGFYADKEITLELGLRVVELDLAAHGVLLDDGRQVRYDRLLLATGSRVRKLALPGAELAGVYYLRTIADVDAIAAALAPGARVLLVGAGYIGLEVAAVAAQRGFAVTVLEALDRVMARVVAPEVSAFYDRYHRDRGVAIHYGAAVNRFHGAGRVAAVETADGRRFDCDVVIGGIGIVPNVALAQAAGLPCDDGIVVDEFARTADPHVFAAGDCTNQPNALLGRRVRLESVPNAIHQAKVAAAGMLGAPTAYSEVPWFWSDQYDLKLQIAGLSTGHEEVAVRGDPATRSFAAYYLAAGRIIAVDAVNSPHDFMNGKKLVAAGARISAAEIRDPRTDLAKLTSGPSA